MSAEPASFERAQGGSLPTAGGDCESAVTGRVDALPSISGCVGEGFCQTQKARRLVLPPPLSANLYWRSFVPKGGRRALVVVSDEAKAYKRDVLKLAMAAGVTPIRGRVALTVRMYPARPQDWAKRAAKNPDAWDDTVRSIDLDNAMKVLLDALKNVAFDDDAWVRRIDAERMEPDEHGARVVVEITPIVRQSMAPGLFK